MAAAAAEIAVVAAPPAVALPGRRRGGGPRALPSSPPTPPASGGPGIPRFGLRLEGSILRRRAASYRAALKRLRSTSTSVTSMISGRAASRATSRASPRAAVRPAARALAVLEASRPPPSPSSARRAIGEYDESSSGERWARETPRGGDRIIERSPPPPPLPPLFPCPPRDAPLDFGRVRPSRCVGEDLDRDLLPRTATGDSEEARRAVGFAPHACCVRFAGMCRVSVVAAVAAVAAAAAVERNAAAVVAPPPIMRLAPLRSI